MTERYIMDLMVCEKTGGDVFRQMKAGGAFDIPECSNEKCHSNQAIHTYSRRQFKSQDCPSVQVCSNTLNLDLNGAQFQDAPVNIKQTNDCKQVKSEPAPQTPSTPAPQTPSTPGPQTQSTPAPGPELSKPGPDLSKPTPGKSTPPPDPPPPPSAPGLPTAPPPSTLSPTIIAIIVILIMIILGGGIFLAIKK